jgi:SAM-dependent methyltransferase
MPLQLYEKATVERFFAPGYVLANPDVRAAGVDAEQHFAQFGLAEGRLQFNPDIMKFDSVYRRAKYDRFSSLLVMDERVRSGGRFPFYFGAQYFELSEYQFESANAGFGPFIAEIEASPSKNYLDLGCGLRNQAYENCLYLEVYPSITADLIVEPTCYYPIESEAFDGIGCFAVLEHTLKPWLVVEEICRMLKPGGKAFIDWPFLQPIHGFPSHYFNATREGLKSLFKKDFEIELCTTLPHQTPDHTISWVLGRMLSELPDIELRNRILNMSVGDLVKAPPMSDFWNRIVSALPDSAVSELACGNSLIGRKKLKGASPERSSAL